MSHLTDDQLEVYALGRLAAADVPPIEEHLMICVSCQAKLDEIGDLSIGMREALSAPDADAATEARKAPALAGWFGWLRKPAFSMAVGFAALVLVIGFFSNNRTAYAPSASLVLTATRGEMPVAVPARQFDLTLTDGPREGGPFRVSAVNATGASVWNGLAESGPAGVKVELQQRLPPGDYFVRLYSASGAMLHEYGFRVR